MLQDAERDFNKARLMVYAMWSTIGGDGAQKAADNAIKMIEALAKSYFPYHKGTSKERDKEELQVLDKVMRAMGFGDVVETRRGKPIRPPDPPQRESLWEKMLKGVGIKKEK